MRPGGGGTLLAVVVQPAGGYGTAPGPAAAPGQSEAITRSARM